MKNIKILLAAFLFFQAGSLLGVILQRETELRIWGWASAGEELALTLGD